MMDVDELRQWDRSVVWHAFTQMAEYEPFIIERASGCVLVDVNGREYLDGVSSLWCNVHGHRHPAIDAAIRAQLDQVAHVTSLGMSNPTTIRLAHQLVERAPRGLRHVFFSSDGSSAVEVALKMAFQYWRQCSPPRPRKTKYLAFTDAYHGDTLGSVSVGGVARFQELFAPLLFDVVRLPAPRTYRLPPAVPLDQAGDYFLNQVRAVLETRADEIAAVVVEPLVQCAAGIVTHPAGFLRGLRQLTEQHDVLLIADEVAVGFGRTGRLFACEWEDVRPDFLCLGKGITGGYLPLAATLATDSVWEAFLGDYASSRQFFHGHTYGGNPLAAAAALASLRVFDDERTLDNVARQAARLAERLRPIAQHPHVGDVRQRGLIAGIELVRDKATNAPFPWAERRGQQVCQQALRGGVWLRPLGNVIVLMPPLCIRDEQLDRLVDAVEASLHAIFAKD